MKILITGASGFIGGFLVEEALLKGWEVWAGIRKTSTKSWLTSSDLHFIDLNYEDPVSLSQQIQSHKAVHGAWDYIIHNAGITKSTHQADFQRINYKFAVHLIHALLENGIQPTKFVFMSSMGAVGPGNEDSGHPLTLKDKPSPISEYGKSKLLAENFIQLLPDFPWIILRPTGVYGPRERDYFVMIQMINAGFDVSLGFKKQLLNFIYIKDLTRVCFAALECPMTQKTWFVADGDIYSSTDFSKLIQDVLQKKRVLSLRIPLIIVQVLSAISEALSRLTGKPSLLNRDKYNVMKQRNWTCDVSELERDLNFKAEYNLRKGLEEAVDWYKKNGWL